MGGGDDGRGECFLAGAGVDQDAHTAIGEAACDVSVSLRRPALRSPTGAGSDKGDGPRVAREDGGEPFIAPAFGIGIDREQGIGWRERVGGNG